MSSYTIDKSIFHLVLVSGVKNLFFKVGTWPVSSVEQLSVFGTHQTFSLIRPLCPHNPQILENNVFNTWKHRESGEH